MNKFSCLAVAISAATLMGCNSSSSSNDDTSSPGLSTYTVIDGYIHNAVICARESIEQTCAFSTTTNEKGEFQLPAEYADMLITADVVGGLSSDSDTIGLSPRSYTMAAYENKALITPFTSIAAMSDATNLDDVAAELGVSVDELTSDYVASNDSKVHLYARTLASQLAYKSSEDQSEHLIEIAKKTKELVEDIESEQGTDFDFSTITVDVEVDSDGNVSVDELPRVATLSDFLEISENEQALPVYQASINGSYFKDDGVQALVFDDGTGWEVGEEDRHWDYKLEGNQVLVKDDETGDYDEGDEFIYVSNDIGLAVAIEAQDMLIYTQTNPDVEYAFETDELVGRTLYLLADDAAGSIDQMDNGYQVEPMLVAMTFSETEVTMEEGGETSVAEYEINQSGALVVKLSEMADAEDDDTDMVMFKSVENSHLFIGFDEGSETFMLNFFDKDFAQKVFDDWNALID